MAIFFCSHVEEPHGCFSNFSAHPVVLDGQVWPTTEHYFQAMKFPHQPLLQERIRRAATPLRAKRIAWEHGMRPAAGWEGRRDQVMLTAVRAKFEQHADLREILLATGDEVLVERSRSDVYWGDGGDGSGRNRLGAILMTVRRQLCASSPPRHGRFGRMEPWREASTPARSPSWRRNG